MRLYRSGIVAFYQRYSNTIIGALLCIIAFGVFLTEWSLATPLSDLVTRIAVVVVICLMFPRVTSNRRVFVIAALLLSVICIWTTPGWSHTIKRGLSTTAFIGAFFAALSSLGDAAASSMLIQNCGKNISTQRPSRRYAVLTFGGVLFSLLLNYGSIFLLGNLALSGKPGTKENPTRIRRMLLAIERALVATNCWSPLSYTVTISILVVPGATWNGAFLPCLVSGIILAASGWLLDSVRAPKSTQPDTSSAISAAGALRDLSPLIGLLILLATITFTIHFMSGVRIAGVVIFVIPIISFIWIAIQSLDKGSPAADVGQRAKAFVSVRLPNMRSELTLLMMAAFIGIVGGDLLEPVITSIGLDLSVVPTPVLLATIIVLIPLCGQAGLNPLLVVVLIAPILPPSETLGITATAEVLALIAGWSLGNISSPFTATASVVGMLGKVSPRTVSNSWNGIYSLVTGVLLIGWVLAYSSITAP
ncbi:hypothetical protein A8B82_16275 [Sulfitobacter sp. EhC04]|uniref:hypothetical protein n=1 Tax=Sulfitobacter sp. EhC04 TaxID=1849168 RepID=UPI0007F4311E|nr:hypothetical protein [Sulfitobacter sp. EhC04]OAN75951.1 hypothetical protein A8B82_16275 [Sulfitobacter sp. EhC04]